LKSLMKAVKAKVMKVLSVNKKLTPLRVVLPKAKRIDIDKLKSLFPRRSMEVLWQ